MFSHGFVHGLVFTSLLPHQLVSKCVCSSLNQPVSCIQKHVMRKTRLDQREHSSESLAQALGEFQEWAEMFSS